MDPRVIEAVTEAAKLVKYNVGDGPARTKAYNCLIEALLWLQHGPEVLNTVID